MTPPFVPWGAGRRTLLHFRVQILPLLALLNALTACSNDSMDDLQQFVEEVKAQKVGHVKPLPEFKPFETFTYGVGELKDPFTPWGGAEQSLRRVANVSSGVHPDMRRRKELLERFPLDTLKMVGIFKYRGETWALVKAPDDIVYRVKRGNYLGQNRGRIVRVNEGNIALREIVPDGLGGWEARKTALGLFTE